MRSSKTSFTMFGVLLLVAEVLWLRTKGCDRTIDSGRRTTDRKDRVCKTYIRVTQGPEVQLGKWEYKGTKDRGQVARLD